MSQYALAAAVASAREFLLPDTSGHTVASAVAPASPATTTYDVEIYYRVITASTTVTITLTWTDATGAQSISIVPTISIATGSYSIAPIAICVAAGSTISVTATAGTANQVYATANAVQRSF